MTVGWGPLGSFSMRAGSQKDQGMRVGTFSSIPNLQRGERDWRVGSITNKLTNHAYGNVINDPTFGEFLSW